MVDKASSISDDSGLSERSGCTGASECSSGEVSVSVSVRTSGGDSDDASLAYASAVYDDGCNLDCGATCYVGVRAGGDSSGDSALAGSVYASVCEGDLSEDYDVTGAAAVNESGCVDGYGSVGYGC